MTIMWTGFPAAQAAVSGDVVVGLLGGTANQRFLAQSWLFKASNLSDVANKTTSFDNLSPLTTAGDLIFYNGSAHNARLAIGATNTILSVVAGLPAWVSNPGLLIANNLSDVADLPTTLVNLGLAPASNVTFASLAITNGITAASVTTTGLNVVSNVNALTAHSGGGQGSALALTHAINRVTTVAAGGDSVKLPASVAGTSVTVINAAASNSLNVFPVSGDAINALSANTALAVAANSTTTFVCAIAGTWNSK